MTKTSKRQHHIPQMILRYFSDSNEQMYMYDLVSKKITPPTHIKNIAVKNHLYSFFIDDKPIDVLEKDFARMEAIAKNAIDKFVINGEDDYDSLADIINFIALLMMRQPQVVDNINNDSNSEWLYNELQLGIKSGRYSQNDLDNHINGTKKMRGLSYGLTLPKIVRKRFLDLTRNFDVAIFKSTKKTFLLTDFYAVFESLGNNNVPAPNWWDMNIFIHCPITANTCLSFYPKTNPHLKGDQIVTWYRLTVPHAYVEHVNRLSIQNALKCRYIYYADKPRLKKYIRKYL